MTDSSNSSTAPRKLRIVHTVSTLQGGGMEHFVLRIAEAQQNRGHDVSIVALQGGPLEEHARKMGLRAIVLGGSNKHVRLLKGALTMARLRPDITNAHNPTSLHYALFGKIFGGSKLIMTDHAATRGVVRVPGDLERRKTDAVVCVSHDTARRAADHGILHNLLVIQNGVEMKPAKRSRSEVRVELGLPEDRVVGCMVAGFDRVKGHDVLLRALARLRIADCGLRIADDGGRMTDDGRRTIESSDQSSVISDQSAVASGQSAVGEAAMDDNVNVKSRSFQDDVKGYVKGNNEDEVEDGPSSVTRHPSPGVTLLVLGDGGERANIENLIAELGLTEDEVRLLGFRADVPDVLAASDFFTLPSRMEGFSLAILEAMSHRLPVIVTPVGGAPDLVTEGEHGLFVPVDDVDALAAAIARVAADPDFRRSAGNAGYHTVLDRFTFADMNLKYEELYYKLCTK